MTRTRNLNGVGKYFSLIVLFIFLAIMLVPFFIVIINAFKTPVEYANNGPMALPQGFNLNGMIDFWNRVDFTTKLLNSAVISLTVAVLAVVISLLNSYALGIGKIKGRTFFLVFFIMANFLPQEALAYPLYYFAKFFKIYDSLISVIIIFTVIQSAFGTYLLTSMFSTFPKELIEAARMDGCNKFQILTKIITPISMSTLSVLFTFFFIWTWNEFFLPLIMLISNDRQTVPIAISVLQGQHNMDATTTAASALLGILPCILFFILFQRTLTRGVTAGSIK
jgi:raffinose/stachyose/melibiose transport system permease protein